jgi:signal peptidase I
VGESTDTKGIKIEQPAKSVYREWAEAIIIAAILALFVRTFIVQAYKIPSGSMEDTLLIGDHLLVNKFIYGTHIPFTKIRMLTLRDPKRGDVVVFKYPENEQLDYIKRVIGTPGDTVKVINKTVFVNNTALVEPYAIHKDSSIQDRMAGPRDNFGPITVPPHKLFVMGDNRDRSYDSRYWGFVDRDELRGKAFIIYWSWDGDDTWVRWSRIGETIN